MKKTLGLLVSVVLFGALLAGCGAPPPLKSDKYLNDTSLLSATGDGPLSFNGIVPGDTSYQDAVVKIKSNAAYSNVQSQDKPPAASWSIANGDLCCQMSADETTGKVNAVLIKVTPTMTAKQVIDKYGAPKYTNAVDYSDKEVAVAMIYPEKGFVAWVNPGDASSTLSETSPVVMVLYLDPKDWTKVQDTATLLGWPGFQPYKAFKDATPVITPRVTATPQ